MANTTNYNWETPDDTDLVKDGAAAIRTLGSSVDTTTKALNPSTTLGDIEYRSATANTNTRLPIGTTGQILSVVGGVPSWVANDVGDITEVAAGTGISGGGTSGSVTITNSMATAIDAKGDLIGGTGADTFARLAVGANGTVLTADSAETTGLKWATPAAGGGALTLIKTQTIGSGVTSVAVTSAFSSTYENYLITVNGGVMSTNAAFGLQLGSSTSNYYWNGIYMSPGAITVNGEAGNNFALFNYVAAGDTTNIAGIITVIGPNLAKPTNVVYNAWRGSSSRINLSYLGSHDTSTQHTDFTLVVDSGANATGGTIRVYGYQKS